MFKRKPFLLSSLVFLFACFVFFYSCEKETSANLEAISQSSTNALYLNGPSNSNDIDSTECVLLKNAVYKSNGMLVFQDMRHFENCAICLEQEYEAYNDAYDAQYLETTPEQLDSIDIINNFNEWMPYTNFESLHSFSSLRAKIEDEIVQWLETPADVINFEDDPDESIPVMDESERTLLNEDG
jgi:hypothetical protein